jgi:hypothetical protein
MGKRFLLAAGLIIAMVVPSAAYGATATGSDTAVQARYMAGAGAVYGQAP